MDKSLSIIHFNSYSSIPNFKKIQSQQHDQYDLISFAYEISITDIENSHMEASCIFFFYLPYDFYQQKGSINFDILAPEETGNFYNCIYSYAKKKKGNNRQIKCEDTDVILFKPLKTQFKYDPNQDFLINKNLFLSKVIYPHLTEVNELLDKNHVCYVPKDIDNYLIEVTKSITHHFSEEVLNEKLNPFLEQAKSYLLKEKIHNTLNISGEQSRKIKI